MGLILQFLTAGGWDRGVGGGSGDDLLLPVGVFDRLPVARLAHRLHLLHGEHAPSQDLPPQQHCHIGSIFTALCSLPRFPLH